MQDQTALREQQVDAWLDRDAPTAAAALRVLVEAARASDDPDLVSTLSGVCSAQLGLAPLVPTATSSDGSAAWRARADLDDTQRVQLAAAERFAIDVTTIDDAVRGDLGRYLGAGTGDFVFLLYVLDMVPRVRSALAQLLDAPSVGETEPTPAPAAVAATTSAGPAVDLDVPPALWPSIDEFIRVVARLDRLDPVTAELVRLRGARQHRCRMCQSLRNRSAMLAGADDEMFEAVDHYADGGLSPRHTAALGLVDAMIWTPARLGDEVVAAVRAEFSPGEQVELVLDVMRNAANKIAVALAADGANVDEGYEIYDIGADGDPVYGLTLA